MAFAPAEPIWLTIPPRRSARASANEGRRLRLTTMRGTAGAGGSGAGGGSVVSRSRWAGRVTAAAAGWWRMTRATCTAQSPRRTSPYSLVPSSGSTTHSRPAPRRSRVAVSRDPASSSDSTASSGARSARASRSRVLARRSPSVRMRSGEAPSAASRSRRSTSMRPVAWARSAARRWSSGVATGGSGGAEEAGTGESLAAPGVPDGRAPHLAIAYRLGQDLRAPAVGDDVDPSTEEVSMPSTAPVDIPHLSHLEVLEAESIHIIREVAAEFERPGAAVLRRQGLRRDAAPGATRRSGRPSCRSR